MVAARSGVPANVVAVWSQSGTPTASSDPLTGPLSCGDGGAPRGIRTPNRQIRSQPSPVPARPPRPFASLPVLVNGHVAGSGRTLIPARHVQLGRNVVTNSRHGRQTRSLAMRFVDRPCCGRSTRFLICCSGTGRVHLPRPVPEALDRLRSFHTGHCFRGRRKSSSFIYRPYLRYTS
jgi:hypothetical protein